jgi:hypothetical protein
VLTHLTNGRWAPGRSGNPGGRPGGVAEVRELARSHTAEAIERLVKEMNNGDTSNARIAAANALPPGPVCLRASVPTAASIAAGESRRNRLPVPQMSRQSESRCRSKKSGQKRGGRLKRPSLSRYVMSRSPSWSLCRRLTQRQPSATRSPSGQNRRPRP